MKTARRPMGQYEEFVFESHDRSLTFGFDSDHIFFIEAENPDGYMIFDPIEDALMRELASFIKDNLAED